MKKRNNGVGKTTTVGKVKVTVVKPGTTRLRRAIQRVFREGGRNSITGRTLVGQNLGIWPRAPGVVHPNNKFRLNTLMELRKLTHPYSRRPFSFGNINYRDPRRQEFTMNRRLAQDVLLYYFGLNNNTQNGLVQLIQNNSPAARQGFLNWIASRYKPEIRARIQQQNLVRAVNSLRRHLINNSNSNRN
jgi:hypothetical protein